MTFGRRCSGPALPTEARGPWGFAPSCAGRALYVLSSANLPPADARPPDTLMHKGRRAERT
jgi:hypothetical protein